MPPQSDLERLKEVKTSIADRGTVSQADAATLIAIGENLTGECREASELGDVASANAFITELEEIATDRDRENATPAPDDGKGSAELGTDAVHRGADQTADTKPTPNAPVDPAAAKEDLAERDDAESDDEDEEEEVEEEVEDDENPGQKKKVKVTKPKAKSGKAKASKTKR